MIDKESYKKYSSAAYTRSNDFKIDINEDVDLIIHEASYLLAMPSIYISTTMKYNSEKITKENKQKMVDFIKELISEGNKRAKLTLGEWYLWGVGVEQNDQKGAKLLVEVSDTFYKASKILADYYFSKNDKENFIKYSKKASSLGNSSSSYNVGLEYTGNKEYKKAVKYFILSIEQDTKNYDVYYDLGRMYANGYGVEKNYDTAITLIKIAHNNTKTKDILDKSFEMLGIVHTNKAMDAHSKNDFKKAYENYTIAYEQYNDSMAAYKIAVMYFNGEYVKKDDAKTIEYYRKSADLGYRNAQFWIGFRYAIGKGVEKDLDKAIKYISLSAEQSFDMAQMMLWMWYDNGYHTIKQDKAKAKEYLRKAVDQGSKEAKVYWDKAYGK